MGFDPITAGLVALSTLATGASIVQGKKAARAQERAQSEQRALSAAESARERRQQIREERIRQARIEQSAQNTGVVGSSGELGAISALGTNLDANIGQNLGTLQSASNISNSLQEAANYQARATNYQAAGGLFLTLGKFQTSMSKPASKS